jgi:hypothetical protein
MEQHEMEFLVAACEQLADSVVAGYGAFQGGGGNREEAGAAVQRVLYAIDLVNHIVKEAGLTRSAKERLYSLSPKLNACMRDAHESYGWF